MRPSGPVDWGTSRWLGTTLLEGSPFDVEVTTTFERVDGRGPFRGVLLLSSPLRGAVGFTFRGAVVPRPDGSSGVHGRLEAISGTGEFADTAGRGRVRCTADVGVPPTCSIGLDLVPGRVPRPPQANQHPPETRHADLDLAVDLSAATGDQHFASMPHDRTFGTGRLTGTADGGIGVEVLATLDVAAGRGPCFGFVNLVASDGSLLALRLLGNADLAADATGELLGGLVVAAAEGRWAGRRGRGDLRVVRAGGIGTPIGATIRIALRPRD